MNDATDTDIILKEYANATNSNLTWWQRREACRKIREQGDSFKEWAESKYTQGMESVGLCPCCPHPRPNGYDSCAVDIFREDWWLRGNPGEVLFPVASEGVKYAALLTQEERERFQGALVGTARITDEDFLKIMKAVNDAIECGGWRKFFESKEAL